MISPVEATDNDRKMALPFIIIATGILFDVLTTFSASLIGLPEGNPNANPFIEFMVVITAMSIGIIVYNHIRNELFYRVLIMISFITFTPAIYNMIIILSSI